jgi:hypothetical protein
MSKGGAGASAALVCPIGAFERQNDAMERLTAAMNRARHAVDKAAPAEELAEAAGALLACDAYDEGDANCRMCRQVASLRRKAADLVVAAARLSR